MKYPVQMLLRASMTWSIFDIHVIAAFVDPFTSDVIAEPAGKRTLQQSFRSSLTTLLADLFDEVGSVVSAHAIAK